MTLPTMYSEPWAAGPDDPFAIEPCEECGAEDRDYGQHEPGCPSGFPTLGAPDPDHPLWDDDLQDAARDFEDETGHVR